MHFLKTLSTQTRLFTHNSVRSAHTYRATYAEGQRRIIELKDQALQNKVGLRSEDKELLRQEIQKSDRKMSEVTFDQETGWEKPPHYVAELQKRFDIAIIHNQLADTYPITDEEKTNLRKFTIDQAELDRIVRVSVLQHALDTKAPVTVSHADIDILIDETKALGEEKAHAQRHKLDTSTLEQDNAILTRITRSVATQLTKKAPQT